MSEVGVIENAKGKVYQVYSLNGQLIVSGTINSEREEISLNTTSGTYVVNVEGETRKIIKL